MGAKRFETSDPFTDVKLEPMSVAGEEVPKLAVMVKDDEGKFQMTSTVSPGYQLIKNELAQDIIDDITTRSDKDWNAFRHPIWDGRRFATAMMTAKPIFEVGENLKRTAHLGILLQNSYDGSCALHIDMFLAFLQCMNQNISRNRFGSFVVRHTIDSENAEWDVQDAIQQIAAGAQAALEIAPIYRSMAKQPLDMALLKGARTARLVPKSKYFEVIDALEHDSRWGFYNALTQVATHKVGGFGSLQSGTKIGHFFLNGHEAAA